MDEDTQELVMMRGLLFFFNRMFQGLTALLKDLLDVMPTRTQQVGT